MIDSLGRNQIKSNKYLTDYMNQKEYVTDTNTHSCIEKVKNFKNFTMTYLVIFSHGKVIIRDLERLIINENFFTTNLTSFLHLESDLDYNIEPKNQKLSYWHLKYPVDYPRS